MRKGDGWWMGKKGQKVCTMYHEHSPKAGRLREQLKLHADQRRQKLNLLAKSRVLIYGNNTFALSNSAILLVVVDPSMLDKFPPSFCSKYWTVVQKIYALSTK